MVYSCPHNKLYNTWITKYHRTRFRFSFRGFDTKVLPQSKRAYREGHQAGMEVEMALKQYKSHRHSLYETELLYMHCSIFEVYALISLAIIMLLG